MRIVESVLSPKPENANVKSSVLWSERNVRSLKMVPPPESKRTSTLSNVLEGTMNFVRKNVLTVNTLSLFAGTTCMVAVVLAVWAIYMFKEQKAKMRNLQNMVVDMSLSEAKQRNGGVSNLNKPTLNKPTLDKPTLDKPTLDKPVEKKPQQAISSLPLFSFDSNTSKQERLLNAQPIRPIPDESQQLDELRKVQEEVSKLLTNPFNIVMAVSPEKPASKITIEDITNAENQSLSQMDSMTSELSEQRKRFENMLTSYNTVQSTENPKIQEIFDEEDGGDDEDFLKDIELYTQQENSIQEDMEQLQHDLQMMSS